MADMTTERALGDACRSLCGEQAPLRGVHDDACTALQSAFERTEVVRRWDERGRCHKCGHWRVDYCNVDGFHYCETHYPEGGR